MEHCQWFWVGYFYTIAKHARPSGTRNGKLKLKLVRPELKQRVYDVQTRKKCQPCTTESTWFKMHYYVIHPTNLNDL